MRKLLLQLFFLLLCAAAYAQNNAGAPVKVMTGQLIRVTPKLSELNADPNAPNQRDVVRDNYGLISMRGVARETPPPYNDPTAQPKGADPALQKSMDVPGANGPDAVDGATAAEVVQQFDGLGFTNVAPADPTLCVGPNHLIQMINGSSGSYFRIYSKTGTPLSAQTYLDLLPASGFFGQGDPIALYDPLADRFVLCEFGNITGTGNPTHLIMCVSQTADPTGSWYVYRFETPGIFPDYPHWGVWNNAYYATTNDFNTAGTAFLGCSMFAFDRAKMLVGNATATVQISTAAYGVPFNTASNRSLAPASFLGTTAPPANSPGIFAYYVEDALTAAADVDSVSFYTFLPDFNNPANTVIGRLPGMAVAPFKANVCTSRNCAPGCNGSVGYDVLSDRLMHHVYYRRMATHDVITLQHTVDAGGGKAAARWYELRNSGGGWGVHQQGTFSPDASFRFMPSMAMNAAGQMCLGYNLTGGNACGSIAFTGRNAADPLNTMTFDENGGTCGTGYGTFANRWGDYNDMNTDPGPGQDSIFWFTAMYGQANWNTRILKIKLTPNAQYDARTEWVNLNAPGAISALTCAPAAATATEFCNNSVVPYVLVRNKGLTPMTSVTIKLRDGAGGTINTYPQTGLNIAVNGTQQFILPAFTAALGTRTLFAWTELPNGQPDGNVLNDTAKLIYTIITPGSLPVAADFVAATPIVPTGWSIFNPNGNLTWARSANGNGGANGSIFYRNWTPNTSNQIDDVRTLPISTTGLVPGTDSVVISFDVAHRYFGASGASWDTLAVLTSSDCGNSFVPTTYKKWGPALATEGISTSEYTTPTVWRRERVAIGGAALSGTNLVVAFRNISRFGNNTFIDNINIEKKVSRDILVELVDPPAAIECSGTFTPRVRVKNNGSETVTGYDISYILDALPAVTVNITGASLAPGGSELRSFPTVSGIPSGNRIIRARTNNPVSASGSGDQTPSNDELTKNFLIRNLLSAPFTQGFEAATFPPTDWSILNPNNNVTWIRSPGGRNSSFSAFIDNFSNPATGQIDQLRSAPVFIPAGVDSLIVTFDLAHKNYPGFDDGLSVLASSNCGTSFVATGYNKSGATLATAGSSTANYTVPAPGDWRTERVAIGGAAIASGSTVVAFQDLNGYGNNIFLDNINMRLKYKRDLAMSAVVKPSQECSANFTPSVRVTNEGSENVTAVTVVYRIDNLPVASTTLTGLNLAPGASQVLSLTTANGVAVGPHTFTVYSTTLVTTGGSGDLNLLNDTLARPFTVYTTVSTPLVETFETSFTNAPNNWGINNADFATTWSKASTGANNSTGSVFMKNFTYANANGTRDELVSPLLNISNVDSVFMSFDVAALTRVYPGSTAINMDTLEVLVTKDCGVTFTSIWKKWGPDLQTVNDPNYSNSFEFVPGNASNWRNVKMNITRFTGTSATGLQFVFRNSSNGDNNVFLDNINVNTLTLPAILKAQGYQVYPSPFTGTLNIQHFLPPTDLRYVDVYNARGQLVASQRFGAGGANSQFSMDLKHLAAGVYTVKLGYTNKQIVERVVKTN
jgi:hypothetical protein